MKKPTYLLAAWLVIVGICPMQARTITRPGVKTPTTFAIIIDETSYAKAHDAVEAYRRSVEQDGLGTYVAVDNWKSPDDIRTLLQQWHADKRSPLEGCVFIGDIPIPMLRDAQHLCSAFKMDQRRDWKRSSVPSDRFYDDFGLTFDFLKQDTDQPLYYYYSLRPDSRQYLSPDIYSARIKPVEVAGTDKYRLLADYLQKVAEEKTRHADNVIDHLSMGRGHGYNSEDPVVWSSEQIALREQLPRLFRVGGTVKFFEFDSQFPMKNVYLNEVQRPDLDIMLFHHHGDTDVQYINGYENVSTIQPSIENIKRFLRSKVPSMAKKSGREEAIAYYMKNYGVPRAWCEEAFDAGKQAQDSLFNLSLDIHTADIRSIRPNARFVMFDACFNGSFHEADYIAGAYIFGRGKTIAAQGGTVNTIQDKWPDEFLGLLAAGMRVGQFNRLTCFLENHLIGDPTFHFANNTAPKLDINRALALRNADAGFWKKQLASSLPDMQALALRQLSNAGYASLPALLEDTYFHSEHFVVRLEAMRLLALNYPSQSLSVLKAAVNDSYELIRRFAVEYVEKNGAPELLPALVGAYIGREQEARLAFKVNAGLGAFDTHLMQQELDKQVAALPLYDRKPFDDLRQRIAREETSDADNLKVMLSPESKASAVRLEIVNFRNHPLTQAIRPLLQIATDSARDKTQRILAVEALGWYNLNHRKQDIIDALKSLRCDDTDLQKETERTLNRLQSKCR